MTRMYDPVDYAIGRLDNMTIEGYCDSCRSTEYRILYVLINGVEFLSIICMVCGKSVNVRIYREEEEDDGNVR